MQCGDFAKGFARVRYDECSHEYLLALSCKGRWFCPPCHQKKVQMFGAMLAESILAVVPHRHFTFTIPKMLRPYFRFQRGLLKQFCRIAYKCVRDFLRDAFGDVGGAGNAAHSIAIVARADQESLGGRSAAVPSMSPRNAHRVTDQ